MHLRNPTSGGTVAALVFALLLIFLVPATAVADGSVYDHAIEGRLTRMWVPDGLTTVRGLLIYGNPAGGDARYYIENNALRGFAVQHGFVIVATAGFGYLQGDEIEIWEDHLAALAFMSGHGEIRHAPWAPLGYSNGGQMSYGFNARRPGKVVGFVANKGGYYNDPLPPEEALLTPGMLVAGEYDTEYRRTVIRTLFEENRARGALWAWVEEQGMGHEGDDERLFLPFLAEAIRLRYPIDQAPTDSTGVTLIDLIEEEGWLVDQTTWNEDLTVIAPHDDYLGDPQIAGWVPSEGVAVLYRAFATRTDWIIVGGAGRIDDRPLYLEVPAWDSYWWDPPGESPHTQHLRIDTREYPRWTRIEFFSNEVLLAAVESDGSGHDSVAVDVTLGGGVHGLSALVSDVDGTVRTTGLRHRAVVGQSLASVVVSTPTPEAVDLRLTGTNPSRGAVALSFTMTQRSFVDLSIFDVLGRRVSVLQRGERGAGDHRVAWDSESVGSGIYFARLQTATDARTIRFMLVR